MTALTTTVRVEAGMRWRSFVEGMRWRLLRMLPSRVLYFGVIHALSRVLGGSEHPDSVGALEVARRLDGQQSDVRPHVDPLLESAWGIIANAGGGNWDKEGSEWREAAERWRDGYHERLSVVPTTVRNNDR